MNSDAEEEKRGAAQMEPAQRVRHLAAARSELRVRQYEGAEKLFLRILESYKEDREALEGLATLYLQAAKPDRAQATLKRLIASWPGTPGYQLELANLLERTGRSEEAAACYEHLIERQPELAVARFNFACYLRRCGRLEEALRQHQRALDLRIDQPEEVLSNMAVIHSELHQHENARAFLHRALTANPNYIPALYNLGLHHEESGDRDGAVKLFNHILELDPAYYNALIRIAHARNVSDRDDPVVKKIRRALRRSNLGALTRESLHFALGKVLDGCRAHDEAFGQFQLGNRCSAVRVRPYDRVAEESRTARIVRLFTSQWLATAPPVSDRPLVFITGLFRSGSTLFEQVLAAHPRVTAGGEIDYFGRLLPPAGDSFPADFAPIDPQAWRALGTGYLEYLDRTFPSSDIVTNKRPDAFALLGLLKALFPNARFINTVREPLDTCLSIYFHQLDDRFGYANDLENIAHHHLQYQRLMHHWRQLFGDSIFDADYDAYVTDRETTTRGLLRFLDLEWHEGCLEFQKLDTRVRTESLWQVREAVYQKSSGRWRNYERHLAPAVRLLANSSEAVE